MKFMNISGQPQPVNLISSTKTVLPNEEVEISLKEIYDFEMKRIQKFFREVKTEPVISNRGRQRPVELKTDEGGDE